MSTIQFPTTPPVTPAPETPKTKRFSTKTKVIIAASVIGVLAVGGALAGSPTQTPAPAAVSTPSAAPVETPSAQAAPTPAKTEAPAPVTDTGYAAHKEFITRFVAGVTAISDAGSAGDVSGMMTACADLIPLAKEGMTLPPTGIATVDKQWAAAMTDYGKGSAMCAIGSFETAMTYIKNGTDHITAATAAIKAAS